MKFNFTVYSRLNHYGSDLTYFVRKLKENTHQHSLNITTVTETFVQRCFVKYVFLKVTRNSQENTCTGISFQIKETLNF